MGLKVSAPEANQAVGSRRSLLESNEEGMQGQELPDELEKLLSRAALLDKEDSVLSSLAPLCATVDEILDKAEALRQEYEEQAVVDVRAAGHAAAVGRLVESLQRGGANATAVERCGSAYRMQRHLHQAVSVPALSSAADLRSLSGKLTGMREALTASLIGPASEREFEAVAQLTVGLSEALDRVATDSSGIWGLVINGAQLKSLLQSSTQLQERDTLTSYYLLFTAHYLLLTTYYLLLTTYYLLLTFLLLPNFRSGIRWPPLASGSGVWTGARLRPGSGCRR